MKRKIVLLLLPVLVALAGCKNGSRPAPRTGEGTITYSVSYPDSIKYGIKSAFFPRQIILVFKDEKATFIASAGLGMIQLVNLMDYQNKKFTSLLIDNLRENYACTLTAEEIKENERAPHYAFDLTDETKTIAGLMCNKAVVNDVAGHTSFDIYYFSKIKFYYWNSPFHDFNYLFTEYTHTINNLTMKLSAIKADFTTPVDTSLFSLKGNYKWVTQNEFYSHLGTL